MQLPLTTFLRRIGGVAIAAFVAGCAVQKPAPEAPPAPQPPACTAAAADEALVGNWLAVRKEKGVAGELRTLFTLREDGTVSYSEQLKRRNEPSQGLSESGCWHRENNTMVMRTLTSNGEPVDTDDPIYVNRYIVEDVQQERLQLQAADGVTLRLRRMSPGYRLPF